MTYSAHQDLTAFMRGLVRVVQFVSRLVFFFTSFFRCIDLNMKLTKYFYGEIALLDAELFAPSIDSEEINLDNFHSD